ncbi:MAG TPA: CHAT domain-containing protein [Pirellulales bacterium]|nr:CHAT domain-containing protein [Pirellulales bacterium]
MAITIATLWKVSDDASRSLMIEMYENLWGEKKMSKLEALRQAQLSMLREGVKRGLDFKDDQPPNRDHRLPPYYWAAFVLSGDWR